ncbi:hypothetical protein [Skermanella sp. TT6]|nr:hypothetical protein [Skermanella sp. TT6]
MPMLMRHQRTIAIFDHGVAAAVPGSPRYDRNPHVGDLSGDDP